MRRIPKQAIRILGYAVCPLLTAVPLVKTGMTHNYTVVLNDPDTRLLFFLCNTPAAVYLVWMFRHVCPLVSKKKWHMENLLLYADSLAVLLLPYHKDGNDLLSNLHVLLAYADFVLSGILLFQIAFHDAKLRTIYLCGIITVLLFSASLGYVSGISELIYAYLLLYILTTAWLQKEKKENP